MSIIENTLVPDTETMNRREIVKQIVSLLSKHGCTVSDSQNILNAVRIEIGKSKVICAS